MGYGTRPGGGGHTIRTFWPDDDENTMYIDASGGMAIEHLMEKIDEKWPGSSLEDITISHEHINTDCLGYDLYDPSDYTNFFVLTRK
jgi:hypothetical protein